VYQFSGMVKHLLRLAIQLHISRVVVRMRHGDDTQSPLAILQFQSGPKRNVATHNERFVRQAISRIAAEHRHERAALDWLLIDIQLDDKTLTDAEWS
jgi:hypothetical protein